MDYDSTVISDRDEDWVEALGAKLAERALWLELTSPFRRDGSCWTAGATPHATTGWNGRPDWSATAPTAREAGRLLLEKVLSEKPTLGQEKFKRGADEAAAPSPAEARAALYAELERLDTLELDPAQVSAALLKRFDTEGWPEGWYWPDQSLWEDHEDDEGNLTADPAKVYDIRGWQLEREGGETEDLEYFVRKFAKAQQETP